MGIFGTSNDLTSINEEVESATNEKSVDEDWGVIMNICDKAGKSAEEARGYLKAIVKRLYNSDPHVGIKAITLLDACVKNSGKAFHIEVASREFENDFTKLMNKAPPTVAQKLRESLKRWAENEFQTDVQLNLIPSLYYKLKSAGYDFSSMESPSKKTMAPASKDPNVVDSQEEEEQILKAIELSLKETGSPKLTSGQNTLYPSMNLTGALTTSTNSAPVSEQRKVRALYDFEAAEDNELTFSTGEIIFIIDDSDPNWWKGSNQRGEGLFPANFVTADLSVEPEKFLYEKARKMVQFKETMEAKCLKEEFEDIEINEDKIDRLLNLLHEADPTNPERDPTEMLNLEREVIGMGPLIDAELERVDRKHAQLTQLSADLVEALSLYHMLMREPQYPTLGKISYGYPMTTTPMAHSNITPTVQGTIIGQGLPPGHDRSCITQSGTPQVLPSHFTSIQLPTSNHPNPNSNLPSGIPADLPPHESHNTSLVILSNYGPNTVSSAFPQSAPAPQTNLQNGSQQEGSHFGASNANVTH